MTNLVTDLESKSAFGWGIEVFPKSLQAEEQSIHTVVPCAVSASSSALRQFFMKLGHSIVCRMGSDDFLAFVDQDLRKQNGVQLPVQFVTRFVGKVYIDERDHYWVFANMTLNKFGAPTQEKIVTFKQHERITRLPCIEAAGLLNCDGRQKLAALSTCIRAVYRSKFMHILHLLTSVLKAIHYDIIMEQEHFVPVGNISGPANTGKTLGCAIALQLLQSPELMLSRCTASSMIDTADSIKNMLIVWDDPRDCAAAQLSAIVHEAFNGLANCTISRGTRHYHSSLIIGTQQPCLGMQYNGVNVATFSRLSHVSMDTMSSAKDKESGFDSTKEPELQSLMKHLGSVFPHLLRESYYNSTKVWIIFESLKEKNPLIISRSLFVLAIDCHLVEVLRECGFTASTSEIKNYFFMTQPAFLQKVCPRSSPLQQFLKDVKSLMKSTKIPASCFKGRVMVDLKDIGPTLCFAVQLKEFLPFLMGNLDHRVHYTKEQLQSELRMSKSDGVVSHNVAFKIDGKVLIKRSLVIRRALLDNI